MKILRFIGVLFGVFLFELATGWIRAFDTRIDVPIMFFKYFFLTLFLIKKRNWNFSYTLISFLIGILMIPIVARIVDHRPFKWQLGDVNMIVGALGAVSGCFFTRIKMSIGIRLTMPVLISFFSIWYIFFNGFDYYCQLLDGESFTGKVKSRPIAQNWKVYNKNYDTFTSVHYNGKIVYLDFWSTDCGVCFVKFPELEALYLQYKNHPNVIIQAVNIPIGRDTLGMAFRMIERRNNYTFPVVIGTEAMRDSFKVEAYPTVVILNDNKVVFRGRMELAKSALADVIKKAE